jgi:hypothetical protein
MSRTLRLANVRRLGCTSVASIDSDRSSTITRLLAGGAAGLGAWRHTGPAKARLISENASTAASGLAIRGIFVSTFRWSAALCCGSGSSGARRCRGISADQPLSPSPRWRASQYTSGVASSSKSHQGRSHCNCEIISSDMGLFLCFGAVVKRLPASLLVAAEQERKQP